jgi:hypothetical protein
MFIAVGEAGCGLPRTPRTASVGSAAGLCPPHTHQLWRALRTGLSDSQLQRFRVLTRRW